MKPYVGKKYRIVVDEGMVALEFTARLVGIDVPDPDDPLRAWPTYTFDNGVVITNLLAVEFTPDTGLEPEHGDTDQEVTDRTGAGPVPDLH